MNKVFKVIWSEARNAYVVVSEMAKSHGTKSCSTKKLLAMLIATGVMTCASVAPVMAANLAPEDYQIEAGNGASASGQGSVAIGNNAQASGLVGIAVGRDAVASGTDSIAIGSSTKAGQTYSVAVGNDIGFTAYAGTAVGQQAYASGDNATAIGTMTNVDAKYNASHDDWRKAGAQSTAIGAYAGSWGLASTAVGGFSKAEGKLATAIGYHSQANVDYGTALGDYSEVTAGWGVAIGASSIADREAGVVGAFAPEGADSLTWRANGGAVSVGSATLTRQITNVAAGTADTDAVNVAQLQEATQNTAWHLLAEEEITKDVNSTTKINHGDIVHFRGTDDNITISKEETEDATVMHIALSRNLVIDSVQAGNFFMNNEKGIGFGGEAYITQNGLNANDKVITNVAAGEADTDAVNVSQLNKVSVEAGKHSVVTEGANITVTPEQAEDGRMQYNVALNNDILLSGDNDAFVNISGSNGSVWASSSVAAGNVIMDGTTATVSGLGNTTTAYDGFANGEGKAATEEQFKEISKVADNANQGWNLSTNGGEASKVAPGETVDISGDKNIKISNDGTNVKVKLNENIDVNSVQTNALNSKYNLSVGTMAENGIMPFFVNSTGAFYAAHNKFSVDKDGNVNANSVQTNALNSKYNLSVGTMAENGIMPFFVNSTGAFYAAGNKFSVDKDGNANANSIQTNALNAKYNLSVGTANENGTMPFFVNSNGAFYGANGSFVVDKDGNVTAGNVVLNNGVFYKNSALRDGELFIGDNDGNYSQITTKGAKLGKVTVAEDGKISGVAAGEVSKTSTDAINGSQLNQTNENVAQNKADIAANKTAIEANRADIDKNKADIAANKTAISDLNTRVDGVEKLAKQHTTVKAGDNNIKVSEVTTEEGRKEYTVALDKNITVDSVKAGDTTISDKGLEIKDGPSVTKDGINAANKNITNVADGKVEKDSKDAINGGQLHQAKADINNRIDGVENQVVSNTNRINQLGSRVNKVGAGAAALAALHPMDFDPDDKLTFSAGYGNYGGENAAAIGAYYRPDEKVMFSVGGTVGNGENMVNAGVSFSLDRTNHVSNSRTAMAREILDLRAEVTELKAMVAKGGLGSIAEDKMKIFPDVAENHWAYEYVGKLAAAGIIEGYPDGKFSGDRMMSRYEFAAMLYRAMQKGAQLDSKIINEFAPEMGRIRVDRISGEDGDRDKIERVRVNAVKGERDHYGNKIAKAEAKAK